VRVPRHVLADPPRCERPQYVPVSHEQDVARLRFSLWLPDRGLVEPLPDLGDKFVKAFGDLFR